MQFIRDYQLNKRERWWLVGIVLVAVLLRVGMVLYDQPHQPGGDEVLFVRIAQGLVRGEGFSFEDVRFPCARQPGMPTASRAPGAPYWLAGWFWLVGQNYLWPCLLVAVLSGLSTYLLFDVGARLVSKPAGFAAAVLWTFSFSAVFTWYGVASLIAEPIALVLLIAALYGLVRAWQSGKLLWAAAAGLCIALATLLRPPTMLLILFLGLWALGWERRKPVFLALGVALVVQGVGQLPWFIRNYRAFGKPVAVSSYGGTNLYISNNSICIANRGALNQKEEVFEPEVTAVMRTLPEVEADRYCRDITLRYLREHPRTFLYLAYRRALQLWDPSVNLAYSLGYEGYLFDGTYLVMMLLAVIGFGVTRRTSFAWLCVVWATSFLWIHLLITTHPRYRQPADPALILLAAAGAAWIWQHRRGRVILGVLAVGAVLATAFSSTLLNLLRAIF